MYGYTLDIWPYPVMQKCFQLMNLRYCLSRQIHVLPPPPEIPLSVADTPHVPLSPSPPSSVSPRLPEIRNSR